MPVKDFEQTIRFYEHQPPNGPLIYLPLVSVVLITPLNSRISLSLMFDTGATVTSLRSDLYPLLGLHSWDQGEPITTDTANDRITVYRYSATLEIFGKLIACPIHLIPLPQNPLYCGLLGRETIFNEFGFGFWESTHELYVTENP